jgi:hypothetical protein
MFFSFKSLVRIEKPPTFAPALREKLTTKVTELPNEKSEKNYQKRLAV